MKKKIIANILIITILLSFASLPVSAVTNQGCRALSAVYASLYAGSSVGTIRLEYYVGSEGNTSSSLGISQIDVYSINGIKYKTIIGSTGNGLIVQGPQMTSGTYTISCQANTSYYCVVTFYSQGASGTHTMTYTTNTIRSTPEYNK